mgnify:CR=1 FL=1|jgi:outer membrane lipoprotein-sorting protein
MEYAEIAEDRGGGTMKSRMHFLNVAMAAMLVFVVLFFSFYIASEASHDCVGEDCPICQQISVCENVLRNISLGAAVTIGTLMLISILYRRHVIDNKKFQACTLISLKVELLN